MATEGTGFGGCGDQLRPAGPPPATLRLTGSFPSTVATGEPHLAGEVTLENTGDTAVAALTAVQPDVVVTRSGVLVTEPLARDDMALAVELAPGAGRHYPAEGTLVDCTTGGPLAPGAYEVHAVLDVRGPDGELRLAVGGPWPLEIT